MPQSSEAVQVRVTLYSCGVLPGVVMSSKVTNGLTSHKSVAVANGNAGVAGHNIGETTTGQVITGGVLSVTEIVRLQKVEFPQLSVAVQVRVTLYSCGQIPPGVVRSSKVTTGLASHKSVAVAGVKIGVARHSSGETTTGQVIIGGVLSVREMVRLQEVELPQASVAVQLRVYTKFVGQACGPLSAWPL